MMVDYITLLGFILTVLLIGVSFGRLIERFERFLRITEDEFHTNKKSKNDRR